MCHKWVGEAEGVKITDFPVGRSYEVDTTTFITDTTSVWHSVNYMTTQKDFIKTLTLVTSQLGLNDDIT